jgi:diaminopimelate epimerase
MKITLPFLKMHGLANDFVIVDGRGQDWALTPGAIRALAHRKTGIGCDQVVVLRDSSQADVRMIIMNADGGEVVTFDNVGLRYGTDREILSDVSFTLHPGGFYFRS